MPYPQGFSPIPSKNLCPQTHHWRRGCQQAPGGEWLPNSPGTGVRRETEAPTMPGRGGDNKGQQGTAGAGPEEEQGARVWVWVTPPAPDPLLSGMLGGRTVHARCRKQPHVPCVLILVHESLFLENLSFKKINNLKQICWDRLFKSPILTEKTKRGKKKNTSGDPLLAQVSSHKDLEASSIVSGTKIPQWKIRLVGTETMLVEMGVWARAMAIRVGKRWSEVAISHKPYKPRESHPGKTLKVGAPLQYS